MLLTGGLVAYDLLLDVREMELQSFERGREDLKRERERESGRDVLKRENGGDEMSRIVKPNNSDFNFLFF